MTSSPRTIDDTSCGTTSKAFLNTIATGLFVNWEKRNVLIDAVVKTLRERFHTCVEFGDRQSDGTCQLILYALNPLSPPPPDSPSSSSLSSSKFAGSKALLKKYLTMIKASRPNFHFEKQPETIDLDSSDDETPVTIIRHGFESNSSKPDDGNDEERVKNEKEPLFIEKSSNVNVLFVDLIDENEKDESLASDVECGEVKSSAKIMKKPDSALLKENDPIHKEDDDSLASDVECVFVKSPENEEQTQAILDISEDVIIVDACDKEHYQNNLSNKGKQNVNNFKITSFRGERMVCFTPESDTTEENYKRYYPWEFESGNCKSKGKKKRPMSDKVSKISKKRKGEAGPSKEKCTNERMELPKPASMIGNETIHTVEGSANDNTNELNEVNSKENDSSVATSSETKNIGTLLSYRRLPHLTQKSANKSPPSTLSNIFNPVGPVLKRSGLRPIVIDASNVAISHGKSKFSTKGLQICINYFEKRGHRQIKAFVPQYRKNRETHDALERMEHQGTVVITPSRRVDNKTVASYDDRFIVQYAHEVGGIIISRDNFRDLALENPEWKETIERRTLMFSWVEDMLMFPQDPLGKDGPSLDKYLRFPD